MVLDVGNLQEYNEPSAAEVAYYVRNLPHEAQYVTLRADDRFIQAVRSGSAFRVQLRQGGHQRYVVATVDGTEQLFQAFRSWDEPAVEAVDWKRLAVLTNPGTSFGFYLGTAMTLIAAAAAAWSLFD